MAEKYILKNHRVDDDRKEYIVFSEDMLIRRRLNMTTDEAVDFAEQLGLKFVSPMQAFNAQTRENFLEAERAEEPA